MLFKKSKLSTSISLGLLCLSSGLSAAEVPAFIQSPNSIKQTLNNPNDLILATGTFDPKTQALDFSRANISNNNSQRYGIVQFWQHKANYKWLQKHGFKVLQNLPNNAYVINWLNQDKKQLTQNKDIRWFGAFQTGYKVSPDLWSSNRQNTPTYQLSIQTFKDVNNFKLTALISKDLKGAHILKTNVPKNFGQYVIEVNATELNQTLNLLAKNEDIQWLALFHPQKFYNNEAVSATQASSIPVTTPIFNQGIYGTGQIIGIADSGLDRNEDWFVHLNKGAGIVTAITDAEAVNPPVMGSLHPNNKVIAYWTMPGALDYDNSSFHGTHVSGSVAGDRLLNIGGGAGGSVSSPISDGYDNDDGMAPNAQILFQDIGAGINPMTGGASLSGIGSYPMWKQAFTAGAAIHSNSYGSDQNPGVYDGESQRADKTLRDFENMIILFAAGNSGPSADTIGSPATAKNVTTVGYLNHGNSTTINTNSSRGPTDDGRLKPDISATGTNIQSASGDTNNTNSVEVPLRKSLSGTSMATPITAGSTALLRQYFIDGFYPTGAKNPADSHTPSGPLMKAVLLNGTNTDGGFFANNIGWGRVWLDNSLYFSGESKRLRFWEVSNFDGLKTGEQFSTTVTVQTGQEFRATLVWYDLEGPTGSGVTLVNNLDLTVSVGANTYLGNNFSANNSVTGGSADAINTVEQVRFAAPISGNYTITIDASNIPGNGSFNSDKQGFALVVSGDLSSGNTPPSNPANPSSLAANSTGLSGIDLTWSDVSADYDSYEIYRSLGSCATADLTKLKYVGQSNTNSFTDSSSQGGYQYSYKVRAFSADLISDYSNCADATSQQICALPPTFDPNSLSISSNTSALCAIGLTWQSASSNCPAASAVQYNVYRSTTHDFIASAANLIATTSANAFSDTTVISGQPYFYVVKAEDSSSNGSGPNSGNESIEVHEVASTALGTMTVEGSLIDDVDNFTQMQLRSIWSISNDQASNGLLSYRSARQGSASYTANTCARMYSTTFSIPATPASPPSISYQSRYNIEADWDGVVVEISTDGGTNWTDLPPNGGYPGGFSMTGSPPINACGYASTHGAFNGSTAGAFQNITHDLTAYQGQTVQIRWSLSSDPGSEFEGFYLDELNYNNILVPQACLAGAFIFADGFEN